MLEHFFDYIIYATNSCYKSKKLNGVSPRSNSKKELSAKVFIYLQSFDGIHATVTTSPHEPKPLDPVVCGHGRVPDTSSSKIHGLTKEARHKT